MSLYKCSVLCNSKCCRYICLEIDAPRTSEDFEEIKWFLCHEGVSVFKSDGDWHLQVEVPCKHLNEDNLCDDYGNRPGVCREYEDNECEYGGMEYELYFDNRWDFERYLKKRLSRKRPPAKKPSPE